MQIPSLGQVTSQSKELFKRFPLSVISSLIAMFLMLYLIEVEGPESDYFLRLIKIVFTASLGVFMFTALRLLGDKNPLCLLGIVALVGYYFILPDMEHPSFIVFERHFFLILGFFIMIFWANYWKSNPSNEEFWEWTQRVSFGFVTSIFFSIVLYAGLCGALYSIDTLFSLDIADKRYAQLVLLVIGLFGVNYFLSQIPKPTEDLHAHTYSKVENIFTKFILTPLVIGYFLILYSYTFKILITQSFPKGILAWIIIAFSIVAVITYLFWTPIWSEKAKKYRRFLFLALFLQTLMLGLAISMRVGEYAWTEHRVLVALFGLWLFGISLYFLLFKDAKYKWVFISLSTLIMISQISAYEIGKKSQQHRLQNILNTAKPLSEKSDLQTRYEISDIIQYLHSKHGIESLQSIIPDIVQSYQTSNLDEKDKYYAYDFPSFATKELGFIHIDRWQRMAHEEGNIPFSLYRPPFASLDISDYDWMVESSYIKDIEEGKSRRPYVNFQAMILEIDTMFTLTPETLEIKENNITIANIALKTFFTTIVNDEALKLSPYEEVQDKDKLNFTYHDNNVSIKLYILEISTDQNTTYEHIRTKVLYKRL